MNVVTGKWPFATFTMKAIMQLTFSRRMGIASLFVFILFRFLIVILVIFLGVTVWASPNLELS
ncbi:hypothetical protein LINPERPRIM_LOCUS1351 [Linum perenne]